MAGPTTTTKPCMSHVHAFNHVGGRPDERLGSRGSFTPGVRIMSGGQRAREQVPPETFNDDTHRGKVLFVSSTLKPDLSSEARTNVIGGRPTERLGVRGSFTPGSKKRFLGGTPRDMPLGAGTISPGEVLFVSSIHKPDMSGEARVNAVRPDERLGSRGSFTPGVRVMSGGPRGGDAPAKASSNHGGGAVVLHVSSTLKPDLSSEGGYNAVGGRPTERLGSRGSFAPGARAWLGGAPRDVPLEAAVNPGKVLFVSSVHKPDLGGEARTNAVRPDERLGTQGSFTTGARRWLGGEPRDVPAEREVEDHGTVLFPPPPCAAPCDDYDCYEETNEAEEFAAQDERQPLDAVPLNFGAAAAAAVMVMVDSSSGRAAMVKENSGVFLRSCGSDTHLSALTSESPRPGF